MMRCLGCKLANHVMETNVILEDDLITCILDIDPLNEGHTLILPKRHYKDLEEIDKATIISIMNAAVIISKALKEIYQPDGISTIQNGGEFNDLDHYHMHVFPRYKNDGFGWVEPINEFQTPLDQVKERIVDKLNTISK
ncbi:HIT family protein [Paenibacillus sp. An7]|uniref:HIT family protein n=1 Tax=Paenibacillus sp. An7 TaxID=2689577 RepID=UPI001F2E0F02|nr:HIT family protein [Paenibacillus sp. An7]